MLDNTYITPLQREHDEYLMPRIQSIHSFLQSIWDVFIHVGDYTEDTDGFDEALQMFITSHCTAEDWHNLVQQLLKLHKPLEVNCESLVM
jgi:hypothetical protein